MTQPIVPIDTDDSLTQYLQEIRRYPLLTPEQELELARGCAEGNAESIKTMVVSNLRLVVSVAKEYADRGVPVLDLIQEGSIGLIAAAKKFDYTRNVRFSTYATKWIRQGVARCVMNHNGLIRIPHYTAERMNKVLRVQNLLTQQNGEAPTDAEIAKACDLDARQVRELLSLLPKTFSMDTPVGENGEDDLRSLLEDLQAPQPQEELVRKELKNTLDMLLSLLTERQQQVLKMHYGIDGGTPCSFQTIADQLDISKERVRQIQYEAMEKLKKIGADFGLEDFLGD